LQTLRLSICRLPHNRILGMTESAYPLWMGYLVGAIRDYLGNKVSLNTVDGETLSYGPKTLAQRSRFIHRALVAFFPRQMMDPEALADFASNPNHPAWEIFMDEVLRDSPGVIATSCLTNNLPVLAIFCKLAKRKLPHSLIIVGGIHPTVDYPRLIEQIPGIDYCCIGEGEETFREFIDAIVTKRPLERIAGLYSRQNPSAFVARAPIADIDTIPNPIRDLQATKLYRPEFHIFSSRGCPFKCSFCSSHLLWSRRTRFHSVKRIMSEMEDIVENFNGERIIFVDDTFTVNRRRAHEIADAIVQRGYDKLSIHVNARIDAVDEALLDKLALAGVKSMSFGIETGSERIQKTINKNLRMDDILRILEYTRSIGMISFTYYIVGHPTETVDDVHRSIDLIRRSGAHKVGVCAAQPLPGTEWFGIATEKGFELTHELALKMDQLGFPVCNMTEMPTEVLNAKTLEIYKVANRGSQIGRIRQAGHYYWQKMQRKIRRYSDFLEEEFWGHHI
jgi:anaerobic magnesium-protoporphyrin IX monomethyl ester cyclase